MLCPNYTALQTKCLIVPQLLKVFFRFHKVLQPNIRIFLIFTNILSKFENKNEVFVYRIFKRCWSWCYVFNMNFSFRIIYSTKLMLTAASLVCLNYYKSYLLVSDDEGITDCITLIYNNALLLPQDEYYFLCRM